LHKSKNFRHGFYECGKAFKPRITRNTRTHFYQLLSRILRISRLKIQVQYPLNPAQQAGFIRLLHGGPPQGVFPDAQDMPISPPQDAVHQPVAGEVGGELLFPESAIALGLRAMLRTPMPETTVHEEREPHLPKNEIRPDAKGRAVLPHRLQVWAARQHGPTNNLSLPPPAGDVMFPQQPGQHHFRGLVPARADARHHLRTLCFGKDIRHFFLTTD
jgi:hypothetical protein